MKSPRLGAHSPEPMVDIHPDDASRMGITDGGFAKVTTPHAGAVFRVTGCTPQRVGLGHAADQITDFPAHLGSSGTA